MTNWPTLKRETSNILHYKSKVSNELTNSPASDPAVSIIGPHTDVSFIGDGDCLDTVTELQGCGQMHHSHIVTRGGIPGKIWMLFNIILNYSICFNTSEKHDIFFQELLEVSRFVLNQDIPVRY